MNAIRSITEQRCIEYQRDAAFWAAEAAYKVEHGLDARGAQAASSICHNEARIRLERLLGIDAIVEIRA